MNSVSASNFASTRGKCYGTFLNVASRFWRADGGKKTKFLSDFPISKAVWDVRRRAKSKEIWIERRKELVFDTRRITIPEFSKMLGISFGPGQSILKAV
jgi:hypothetical protein